MSLISNYTVVGNPTISSDFILSSQSEHDYIVTPSNVVVQGSYDLLMKVSVGTRDAVGHHVAYADYLNPSAGSLYADLGSSLTNDFSVSTLITSPETFSRISRVIPPVQNNKAYWLKISLSEPASRTITLNVLEDDNYTYESLPTTGWLSGALDQIPTVVYNGCGWRLGFDVIGGATQSIDLKNVFIEKNGAILWRAVTDTSDNVQDSKYINYTIVGEPSYSSGVFSGFSQNDFLVLPQALKNLNYTYITKFTTDADITSSQTIMYADKLFSIEVSDGKLCTTRWSSDGAGFTEELATILANTTYYVKVVFSNGSKTFYSSADGSTWTSLGTFTDTGTVVAPTVEEFRVGTSIFSTRYFRGSIDFNETVVLNSLGNIVWKPFVTEAPSVPNYTVVGSPTISSDFIASNFSSSNYIELPATFDPTSANSWEFVSKITISDTSGYQKLILGSGINFGVDEGYMHIWLSNTSHSSNFIDASCGSASNFNNKWVRIAFTGSSYSVGYSSDGENYTTTWSSSSSTKVGARTTTKLGTNNSEYLKGSIDLKETYLKTDGVISWRAVEDNITYNGGSISISSGYYNDGSHQIIMPAKTMSTRDIGLGQLVDCKNSIYASSYNDTASAYLVGDTKSLSPYTQSDVNVKLNHPVYLSHLHNFAAGDTLSRDVSLSYDSTEASVTLQKSLFYNPTAEDTYWYPEAQTVLLSDMTSEDLEDQNSLYAVNTTISDVSSLAFCSDEPEGYQTYLKIPGNVYLNAAHTEILKAGKEPDEIALVGAGSGTIDKIETGPDEVIGTDYTVVGSATVSSDYIASGFSSRNCVAATATLDTSIPWSVCAKITTSSDVSTRQKFIGCASSADQKVPTLEFRNSVVWVCIPNSSGSGWLAEANTGFTPSANTTYWFEMSWSGSVYSVKVSTDGTNYTQIYSYTSSVASYHSDNYKVCFGNDLFAYNEQLPFLGSVDLKECYFKDSSNITWRAVLVSSNNWTNLLTDKSAVLKNITYQYPQGISESVSSLAAPSAYEQDLKGFVFLDSTGLVGYSTAYEYLPASDIAYSGYSYTLTDATATAITALQKTGTFCRVFFTPAMAGSDYVFVPVEDLQDGQVFSVGELKEKYSETNELPFRSLDTSTYSYTYDAFEDTLTRSTDTVLRGIGYAYADL